MRQTSSVQPLILAAACLLIGLAGAYAATREAGPLAAAGQDLPERMAALREGAVPSGLSLASRDLVLDDCSDAVTSLYGRTRPTDERQANLVACGQIAANFVSASPAYGYGWYVTAAIAAESGDQAHFLEALKQSYTTSPAEQWLAERRVALVESHLDWLDPTLLHDHEQDLAMLVQTQRGIRAIARRYVAVPAFRDRITNVVLTLPDADQRRFLTSIKQQIAGTAN
jgi:hypothetical protein